MKNARFFYFLIILILLIFSCQKTEEVVQTDDVKKEIAEEPLYVVSEGRYGPDMILVEGGEFIMGDETVKTNQPHPVKLSSFYIAKYMATNGRWKEFLNDLKLEFTWDWDDGVGYGPFYNIVPTDDCPAQGLNWYYAVIFCNWASLKDGFEPAYIIDRLPVKEFEEIIVEWDKRASGYRLPTEAEWEYAARGGRLSKGYLFPGSDEPNDVGRFGKENKTSYPVGEYKPNELGIHDMGGNASEWCWDWYDEVMFQWLPLENPSVDHLDDVKQKDKHGYDLRVMRGGDWNSTAIISSRRGAYPPENISMTGIRLVRNAD